MIRFKVGLVLMITDGFTGLAPVREGLLFKIDGIQQTPVIKPDGYYVFLNVPSGKHRIDIASIKYRPESLEIESGYDTVPVVLKPGKKYPFPLDTRHLAIDPAGKASGGLWVGMDRVRAEIRISQTELKAGECEMRLFFEDGAKRIRLPGAFLLADEERSEICILDELVKDDLSTVTEPLKYEHKRGCRLYPAQHYDIGEDGRIHADFRNASAIYLWTEGMKAPLQAGADLSEFSLK